LGATPDHAGGCLVSGDVFARFAPVTVEHQHGAGRTMALRVFVVGPTIFILNLLPTVMGSYLQDIAMMSAGTGAEGADVKTWLQSWTVFDWAWWIAWTPYVGMFIARISRGRTIRQFVAGVLLVPSLATS
jgi:choline-glycine betaine transporter